jgi:hypothetical protein
MKATLHSPERFQGTFRREVVLGICLGALLLVAVGVVLSVVDPYLRAPGSPIFSVSAPLGR